MKLRAGGDSLHATSRVQEASTRPCRPVRVLFLPVLALTLAPALAQDESPRTTRDGVYTAEQAGRGQETYTQVCAACHPLDWYKGETVKKSWEGATLQGLYESISTTMPQSNPGSLKPREYVALLAYILSLNDMPTGSEELPNSPEALGKIVIKWSKKP